MGWAENRFRDRRASEVLLPPFWNEVRDSIAVALYEFNERVGGNSRVDQTDCMTKGRYCVRLHRALDGKTVEIFLDQKEQTLKTVKPGEAEEAICLYRLSADRKGIELVVVHEALTVPVAALSVEAATEVAIGEFLFTPFPETYRVDGL